MFRRFFQIVETRDRKNSVMESQNFDLLIQSYKNAPYDNSGNVQLYLANDVM